MKKILLISILLILFWSTLTGCTNNKEIDQLKQENSDLKEKLWINNESTGWIESKPNIVKATISRIWWSLSRQTSIVGDKIYYNSDWIIETLPINWENSLNWEVGFWFNWWGYALIASCSEWYIMTKCEPFSTTDAVDNQTTQCFLWNEDPNLMRTSMIIECTKI